MRRTFACLLALSLAVLPVRAARADLAVATAQDVEVDGAPVRFETYALLDQNGYQTNYAKLRDVAWALRETDASFSVDWSAREGIRIATGKDYKPDGTEMTTPYTGDRAFQRLAETTEVDGAARSIAAIRLYDDEGNGYTYYKLRDLGEYLGFRVDWSAKRGVFVETDKVYGGASRAQVLPLAGTWTGTLDLSGIVAGVAGKDPAVAEYFDFSRAGAQVELVSDRAGRYALTLSETDLAVALEQVKADFVSGMLRYAEARARAKGLTLDQVLQAAGQTRSGYAEMLAEQFDAGMAKARAAVLAAFNGQGSWQPGEGDALLAQTDGRSLTCTLGGKNRLTLQSADGETVTLTRN